LRRVNEKECLLEIQRERLVGEVYENSSITVPEYHTRIVSARVMVLEKELNLSVL